MEQTNDLLPNEAIALRFVENIGTERAKRVLDSITKRIERRHQKVSENAFLFIPMTAIRITPLEVELRGIIKLGLAICDTENTASAARARNLARIKARNERRLSQREK